MMPSQDVEKVIVKLEPHLNADALSIVRIGGFQVVVRTADWRDGDEAAYVFPDALVDTEDATFGFLRKKEKWHRVRAIRLRGERSFGLLVPWREDLPVTHWNPPEPGEPHGPNRQRDPGAPGPQVPKYDLENGRRYCGFAPDDLVYVTEKIHGANAKYVYTEEFGFQCGSRTRWLPADEQTPPRQVVTAEIEALCRAYPGLVLFGEAYGVVGGFPYDGKRFRAFDAQLPSGEWLTPAALEARCETFGVPTVPLLAFGEFGALPVADLAEGQSTLADHVREGVVVAHALKRLKQKWVGFGYLECK